MKPSNRYKWLIVVEGMTDAETYSRLLAQYGVPSGEYYLFPAKGKGRVCNTKTWHELHFDGSDLFSVLDNDSGRKDFLGVILVIDLDNDGGKVFDNYRRSEDLRYIDASKPPKEHKGIFWHLDTINGARPIPIYGIAVPMSGSGCLETDLLQSYGFPVEGQTEYSQFADIIQKASQAWRVPKHGDGKEWWEENQKAKLDKFVYSALSHGFEAARQTPSLPQEPSVIANLKSVMLSEP
jgi:hypothetical protein